ncbi:hypothetical protein, partial [Campylobacter sp.]
MKKITLAMFLMLSSLWAKPTIEFEESVKLHLFGQDFDVPEALINEHTAENLYDRCVGNYAYYYNTALLGEYGSYYRSYRFNEKTASNCDVKFAKKYIITKLKIRTKAFDEMLKNEKDIKKAFEEDKKAIIKIIVNNVFNKYNLGVKAFAIFGFKLKAGLEESPIIKNYTKNVLEDAYEAELNYPLGTEPVKSFNLMALSIAGGDQSYYIEANINITALDPSNINTIFAISDHVLKNRDNKYKNEDLLQNIKAQNDELFQKLQENKAQYQVPENSILLKKQNEQNEQEEQVPLEKLQISNE